ncbi:unnamed protein product [Symbiodinium natans]|uniref:Pentatricopeptide repeat-containing protein n=1 Tax=Symbiodinium natans TaxID=878477 RepID=A0A812RQZ4_9DINO|nr:unnamed protein product [Symbiodinium natans]
MEAGFTIDKTLFNAFFRLCVRKEGVARAERRLQQLLELRHAPDKTTFGILLDAHAKKGDVTACQKWLKRMEAIL